MGEHLLVELFKYYICQLNSYFLSKLSHFFLNDKIFSRTLFQIRYFTLLTKNISRSLWSGFIFPYWKIFFLYSTSLCVSSSGRFLYRYYPYRRLFSFASSEIFCTFQKHLLWSLSLIFWLYLADESLQIFLYKKKLYKNYLKSFEITFKIIFFDTFPGDFLDFFSKIFK